MPYTIAEPCIDIKNKACVAAVDCIDEGPAQLFIHPRRGFAPGVRAGGPGPSGRGGERGVEADV